MLADRSAAIVLNDRDFAIDIKCSDGLYGVCHCGLGSDEVEHQDFVSSKKQRDNTILLCQSRAAKENGVVEIDL